MIIVANVGAKRHVARLKRYGQARMVLATHWRTPVPGLPYALDNGAFGAWLRRVPFPAPQFLKTLSKVPRSQPPFMVVCPDLVAQGPRSLAFTQMWRDRLSELHYDWMPWYLAVQDGMDEAAVREELGTGRWAGIFVGGTISWKTHTAPLWRSVANEFGLKLHIGRVGTLEALRWAHQIGADSVDSSSWGRNDSFAIIDQFLAPEEILA